MMSFMQFVQGPPDNVLRHW